MLRRLGFPDVGPHRRFVSAMGIDALGSGNAFETSPHDNLRTLRLIEDIYAQNPPL